MDTYIASTAILHRLTLVTANIAHFEEIELSNGRDGLFDLVRATYEY